VHKVTNRDISLMTFTEDEFEIMTEMEHARWNVERLLDGWKWGEKKDVMKKISPYLVPWSELPDEVKEWDKQTVRNIPELLARVRMEIRRQYAGNGAVANPGDHTTIGSQDSERESQ